MQGRATRPLLHLRRHDARPARVRGRQLPPPKAQTLQRYTSPDLLLIDDLGDDPLEQEDAREAQLLHKVLEARHGRSSTIVTSNLDVDEWAKYLGHPHLTVALLDIAIRIDGPSYRLAEHKERQLARKPTTKTPPPTDG